MHRVQWPLSILTLICVLAAPQAGAVIHEKVFVTCYSSGTVNVHNTQTQATGSVTVGNGPVGIARNPVAEELFVANSLSSSVSRIHAETLAVTTLNLPGAKPEGIVVAPDGEYLLVTSQERRTPVGPGSNSVVYVVDLPGFTLLDEILVQDDPEGVAISTDGRQAWIACDLKVQELDFTAGPDQGTVTDVITGLEGTDDYEHVAVNAAKSRLYVSNASRNRVEVIDLSTETIISSPVTGSDPEFVLLDEVGGRVYVSNQQGNALTVIDAITFGVTGTASLAPLLEPRGLALGQGPLVWGTAAVSNALYRYNPATQSIVGGAINLMGTAPEELAIVTFDTNAATDWQMYR